MFYLGHDILTPSDVWVIIKALLTERSSGHRAALTMSRVKNAYPEWDQLKEYRARLISPPNFWHDSNIEVPLSNLLAEPKRPGDFEILLAALFECEIYGYRSHEMTLTIMSTLHDKCKEKAATVLPWWCHDWEPYVLAMSKEAGWDLSRVVRLGHEYPGHFDKTRFFYRFYLTEIFGQNVGRAVDVWENYCQCYLKDVIDDA